MLTNAAWGLGRKMFTKHQTLISVMLEKVLEPLVN